MQRILIVEDDAVISNIMAEELTRWGYQVEQVKDFSAVADVFVRFAPQLVLLDLSLPVRSGFFWCGEIRKLSKVPIMFISSAADNMSMVTALHQGADDFIAKPFDLSFLVAKVQAIMRRTYDFVTSNEFLSHGAALLDVAAGTLQNSENNAKIDLTRNEFRILQQLLESKGSIVSREEIMRRLWDDESFIDDNTLTVNMARLRKKLEQGGLGNLIVTKKGEGYYIPQEETK